MRSGSLRPPGASSLLVNLAAEPFVNRRPVQRFTLAMWILGAILAGVNVFLLLQYRHDSTALRTRLAATRTEIESRSLEVVGMGEELGGLRLAAQNAQVDFLNLRIAERTFPWSLLFDRIATTLPDGVRLVSLVPEFGAGDRRGSRRAPAAAPKEELIELKIRGVAKSDEELYDLIDAFFSSPAFDRPRLYHESSDGGEVHFDVDVQYRPRLVLEESHRPAASEEDAERFDAGDAHTNDSYGATEEADDAEDAAVDESAASSTFDGPPGPEVSR